MPIIFIGGDKGGVGKDTVAQAVIAASLDQGKILKIHEVEVNQRLAELFPDSLYHPVVSTSVEEAFASQGQKALEGFEKLVDALDQEPNVTHIVILGASQTTGLLNYLGEGEDSIAFAAFGDGQGLTFAIVTTMQDTAVEGAATNLFRIKRAFPQSRRFVVLNDLVAEFQDDDPWLDKVLPNDVPRIKFARCASPAWGHVMDSAPLHKMREKERVVKFLTQERQQNPKSPTVIVGFKMLKDWLDGVIKNVAPLVAESASAKGKRPTASATKPAEEG
jgi:hypothetical protein